jgi:PAS domain S-box-containing protein
MSFVEILIADDHNLVRSGLRSLIETRADWRVCGEAVNGKEAVEKAKELSPDLVLLDVSMPEMNGLDAARLILQERPDCPILIVSQNDHNTMEKEAVRVGAKGFVHKSRISQDLLGAIEKVVGNGFRGNVAAPRQRETRASTEERTPPPAPTGDHALERNRIREILMQAPTAIGSLSGPEHRWDFVNSEMVRVTGRSSAEDFIGKTIRESMPELEGQEFFGLLDTVYGTGIPYIGTEAKVVLNRNASAQSEETYFNFVYQPLRDVEGKVEGILVYSVDVTNQVLAKTEIEKRGRAGNLLAAIVDSSDDAIVSKNLDGTITSWNKSAERLFGYTSAEAVGQHITLIIPRDRWKEEDEFLAKIRRAERVDHFETVRVRKDGSTIDLSLTISPVKDAFGRVIGASKVARDISERKLAQEELRRSQLQFATEAEALRNSEERLRKLSEALDAEVRARTKELEERNFDVLRQSEQLRQLSWRLLRTQDEERRHIARELHDSAGQTLAVLGMNLSTIVKALELRAPDIAKSAHETQELAQQLTQEIRTTSYLLHPPLLDENGLPAALSWYVRGLMERSGLEIALSISEGFGRLPSDMELLVFRLVQECLTNIHRHSGSKSAAIEIGRESSRVFVQVRDHGKGISAEKLAEIQSRGSGVGIRGMQERLRQFQGTMKIESTSEGTATIVTIPVDQESGHPHVPNENFESAV